jgi:hypothetical protein
MAIDTKPHRMIHNALSHGHLGEISMARRAVHLRPDMRLMVEPHVRFFEKSIHPLPRHVFVSFGMVAQRLDARIGRITDILMTRHADIDARYSGTCSFFDSEMAVGTTDTDVGCMNLMWKIDRLLGGGLDTQEMSGRVAETCMCRCKCGRTPPPQRVRVERPVRITGYIRLLYAPGRNNTDKKQTGNNAPKGARALTNILHSPRISLRSVFTIPFALVVLYVCGRNRQTTKARKGTTRPDNRATAPPPPGLVLHCFGLSSGRGSAWLERLVRDQEVGGSNPLAPIFLNPIAAAVRFQRPGAVLHLRFVCKRWR